MDHWVRCAKGILVVPGGTLAEGRAEYPLDGRKETPCVGDEGLVVKTDGVPRRECAEAIREIARSGHSCLVNKDRYDADTPLERGPDLQGHEVVVVVEPRPAAPFVNGEPVGTDEREQKVARADFGGDRRREVVNIQP